MLCPYIDGQGGAYSVWFFGVKLFLLVWIIAVPVIITSRLEKIIKLLQEKK